MFGDGNKFNSEAACGLTGIMLLVNGIPVVGSKICTGIAERSPPRSAKVGTSPEPSELLLFRVHWYPMINVGPFLMMCGILIGPPKFADAVTRLYTDLAVACPLNANGLAS